MIKVSVFYPNKPGSRFDVEYYLAKLADLYEKFRPFVERPSLFDAAEFDAPPAAGQTELFGDPAAKPEAGEES